MKFNKIESTPEKTTAQENRGYVSVNGLEMYYEIHPSTGPGMPVKGNLTNETSETSKTNDPGTSEPVPLVLLHGAFGTAEGWAGILPALKKNHTVIAIELEGHGRTRDLDRPLSYRQMGDDAASLLKELGIQNADLFGYSMGGVVALQIAIENPELVRKLAILGSHGGETAQVYEPEQYAQFQSIPDDFEFPEIKDPYDRLAPDPDRWPVLVRKIRDLGPTFKGFSNEELGSVQADVLIMQGDRDVAKPEHAVELYRLIPNSQLLIYPKGDHFILWQNPDKVLTDLLDFLN